jgi:hypothetical protein
MSDTEPKSAGINANVNGDVNVAGDMVGGNLTKQTNIIIVADVTKQAQMESLLQGLSKLPELTSATEGFEQVVDSRASLTEAQAPALSQYELPVRDNPIPFPKPGIRLGDWQKDIVLAAFMNQLEQIAAHLSDDAAQQMEQIRTALREGRYNEAQKGITKLKGAEWSLLNPVVKAQVLRLEAGMVLETTDDTVRTRQLADAALAEYPADNQARLRAWLAYYQRGPEAALNLLIDQNDIDSLNFRAALLLDLGRVEEGMQLLSFANAEDENDV